MKRILTGLALGSTLALAACSGGEPSPRTVPPAPIAAAVAVAAFTRVPEEVTLPGTVSATHLVTLATRNGGRVTRVLAQAGERVAKGALLVEIDAADARAALAQAEAQATAARAAAEVAAADERRYAALYREGAASPREYEAIRYQHIAAQAAAAAAARTAAAARSNLAYAEIRAPAAGLVAERRVDPGDFATPGAPLLLLVAGQPEVRVQVAAALFGRLHPETVATVAVDGHNYTAHITQRVAAADARTRTHLVKLALPADATAAFGAYAAVRFALGETAAVTVPASAVVRRADMTGVFVLDTENVVHFRPVRVGGNAGTNAVVIAAGVSAGERVLAAPGSAAANGMRVRAESGSG